MCTDFLSLAKILTLIIDWFIVDLILVSLLEALTSSSYVFTHSLTKVQFYDLHYISGHKSTIPEKSEFRPFLHPKGHQRLMISIQSISVGCKHLSPCLSGVSQPAAHVQRLTARLSPITLCIIQYNV